MSGDNSALHPLGGSIFAYVKTRKEDVKIHIRHYAVPTNTMGGRVVPTGKGVTLDLKAFQRLVKIQKKLKDEYEQQSSHLMSAKDKNKLLRRRPTILLPDHLSETTHKDGKDEEKMEEQAGYHCAQQQQPMYPNYCPEYCMAASASLPSSFCMNSDGYHSVTPTEM